MRWKADKDRLDDMLRLIRRYKRTRDHDIYRLIIETEDDVLVDQTRPDWCTMRGAAEHDA